MTAPKRMRNPQIGRIARLLAVDPDEVHGLDDVPEDELRALHDQIGEAYFAEGREVFGRVAGLSKVLPGAVAGKLAERFLPPHFAARTAEMLDPAKARDLVNRVSVPYLADLSLALDPTRSKPVVQAIPAARVGEVAGELFRRGEYAAMAELAGTVTREALFAALDVASGRDLVTVIPLLVWNDDIAAVVEQTPDAKVDELLGDVIDNELWDEGNYVLERLPEAAREKAMTRAADISDETFAKFRAAADAGLVGDIGLGLLERAEAVRATG